jgi:hypothetical protein
MALLSTSYPFCRLLFGAFLLYAVFTLQAAAVDTEVWLTAGETAQPFWNGSCDAACPQATPCRLEVGAELTNHIDMDCQIVFMSGSWNTTGTVFRSDFPGRTTTFYYLGTVLNVQFTHYANNSVQLLPHPSQAAGERPTISHGYLSISGGSYGVNVTIDDVNFVNFTLNVLSAVSVHDIEVLISNADFLLDQDESLINWDNSHSGHALLVFQNASVISKHTVPVLNVGGVSEARILESTFNIRGELFPSQITHVLFSETNLFLPKLFGAADNEVSSVLMVRSTFTCSLPSPSVCPIGAAKLDHIDDSIFNRASLVTNEPVTLIGTSFSDTNFEFQSTGLIIDRCVFSLSLPTSNLTIGSLENGPVDVVINNTRITGSAGVIFVGANIQVHSQSLIIDNVMIESRSTLKTSALTVRNSLSAFGPIPVSGLPELSGLGGDSKFTFYSIEVEAVTVKLLEVQHFIYAPTDLETNITLSGGSAIHWLPTGFVSIDWNAGLLPGKVPIKGENYTVVELTNATPGPVPTTTNGTTSPYTFHVTLQSSGLLTFAEVEVPTPTPVEQAPETIHHPLAAVPEAIHHPLAAVPEAIHHPLAAVPEAVHHPLAAVPEASHPIQEPQTTVPIPIATPVPTANPSAVLNPNVRTPTKKDNKTAIIVGCVLGIVAAIAIGAGIALYIKFRKPTYIAERASLLGNRY